MKKPQLQPNRTWVEVDYSAIETNARTLKNLLGKDVLMLAAVKSNAYGHGMVESARAVVRGGATWLGVDELTEALELRRAHIKGTDRRPVPILILGYTIPALYKEAAVENISVTISSLDSLQRLAKMKLRKKLRIHIKFDTGLHRQGILETHVQQVIRIVSAKGFPAIVEGIYTHFAVMEDPMRSDYSKKQATLFKSIVAKFNQKGIVPLTHASASSGILFSKDFHFDMSRAGIALYGLWPSPEIRKWAAAGTKVGEAGPNLTPALSWKTIIAEIKLVNKGAKVGYDLTYEAPYASRLAVIPVGYWHGLPRSLSSVPGRAHAQVLVCGKRASIVGRVSMDMCVIDVTDIPNVRQGDEVVIIGKQGSGPDAPTITVEELAERASSFNYELVTRINASIPRIAPNNASQG